MKTLIYSSFLILFLTGCLIASQVVGQTTASANHLQTQDSAVVEIPTPLNIVPEWVKEKLTSEEYEMFKLISTRFRVDYSFLRENLSEKRRAYLNERWEALCQEINNGNYPEASSWVYGVASEWGIGLPESRSVERENSSGISENEDIRAKNLTVYTDLTKRDVFIDVSVTYIYNIETGAVTNINLRISTLSSVPNRKPEFKGSCRTVYDPASQLIQGTCSGTLIYMLGNKKKSENMQNVQFSIKP